MAIALMVGEASRSTRGPADHLGHIVFEARRADTMMRFVNGRARIQDWVVQINEVELRQQSNRRRRGVRRAWACQLRHSWQFSPANQPDCASRRAPLHTMF